MNELVSFEVAKLAKRKGFSAKCKHSYSETGAFYEDLESSNEFDYNNRMVVLGDNDEIKMNDLVAAPTILQLSEWLRVRHKIFPQITVSKYSHSDYIEYEGRVIKFNSSDRKYSSNLNRSIEYMNCYNTTLFCCLQYI